MPPEMSVLAGASSGASTSSLSSSADNTKLSKAKALKFKQNKTAYSKRKPTVKLFDANDDHEDPFLLGKDSVSLVASSPPSSSPSFNSNFNSHPSSSESELTFSPSTCSLCSATFFSTTSASSANSQQTPKSTSSFHYSCSASSSFSSTCSSLSSTSSSADCHRRTSADASLEKALKGPSSKGSKNSHHHQQHHRSHSHSSAVTLTLRPTLQCIRNTLSLADTMKRYDRLSSSKSDLHLNSSSSGGGHPPLTSTTSSGVLIKGGEVEVLEDQLGKSHIGCHSRLASSSEIILVESPSVGSSRKSAIHLESTYSSTENIIPPSNAGDLGAEEEEDHIPEEEILGNGNGVVHSPWETSIPVTSSSTSSSATPLVQLPSTNTFRSFIKTKTSSGIGIMRGKDHHHHHHHHSGKALEEDEEALQLCDSESTVSSVMGAGDLMSPSPAIILPVSSNVTPILLPPPPPPSSAIQQSSNSASSSSSVLVSSSTKAQSSSHHLYNLHQAPLSSSTSVPLPSYQHSHQHQAIFLANPCHSTTSTTSCGGCSISSSTSQLPSSAQTTVTSIDSVIGSSNQLYSSSANSQKRESNGSSKHYHLNSTASSPLPGTHPQSSTAVPNQKQSRHRTFIPPILKPTRFVKNVTHHQSHHGSKGNLLFNVKSHNHKSKSKQRLAEGGKDHHLQRMNSELAVESLKSDRLVVTQPEEDRRRRTIIIEKANNSFGFTLQTYGIKHCREGEVELITYVDEVAYGGPAFRGGMRPGDVILSINGRDVEKADHRTLVSYIGTCEKTMRLVVLFEDCVRKIELNIKYIKLKKALQTKLAQLEILNQRENQLLLNAALRTRSAAEDAENWENNNNSINLGASSGQASSAAVRLKKYKCKSLDVSLDDLNANLVAEGGTVATATASAEPWPGTAEVSATSTTLPRAAVKGIQPGSTPLESEDEDEEDEEEEEDFASDKDEEKRTLHSRGGKRKTGGGNGSSNSATASGVSGGAPRIGSAGTVLVNVEQLGVASTSRSKSLPQSVTNSMDCLTNEAYEDDEDLIGGGGGGQRKVTPGAGLRLSSAATHDKDFITKL